MNIRNKHWIIMLSVILTFSILAPACYCHAEVSSLFANQQHSTSQTGHISHSDTESCDCGHELVKTYQKVKKVNADQNSLLLFAGLSNEGSPVTHSPQSVSSLAAIQRGILDDTGPPLHLMNSVFLN